MPNNNIPNIFTQFIPLYSPAIRKDSYSIDDGHILIRTGIAAFASFGGLLMVESFFKLSMRYVIPWIVPCCVVLNIRDRILSKKAVHEQAVHALLNEATPSAKTYYHIANNFDAAKLLVSKLQNANDLNKVDENGYKLLSYAKNPKIFKLLVKAGADVKQKSNDVFSQTIFEEILDDPERLNYILETKKVTKDDFSESEQANHFINHPNAVRTLCQHGFNVNAKNEKGYTPLLTMVDWIAKNGLSNDSTLQIISLMDCEADPYITVKINNEEKDAFALDEKKQVHHLLKKPTPILTQCPDETLSESLARRIQAIVKACFLESLINAAPLTTLLVVMLPISLDLSITILAYTIVALTSSIALSVLNKLWAEPVIQERNAVNEYLTQTYHSASTSHTIAYSPRAVKSLISKIKDPKDLNKLNENGASLLAYDCFESFKLLVDAGADLTKTIVESFGNTAFELALKDYRSTDYLQYMLETGKVTSKSFSNKEQVNIWMRVKKADVAQMLKTHGFDINVKDDQGYTALMRLAKKSSDFEIPIIRTLLVIGKADKSITVNINGEDKTASQLTNSQNIKNLLDNN